ncbi:FtsX-like permease family protein [Geodermatophilus sp. URMC 64]
MRGLWRLPPWSRAPWLGLRAPAAVVAVLVTTAILACAVASAPLFLSSARSAALQEQLAPQCAEAAWPQIGSVAAAPAGTSPDELADYADSFEWTATGRTSEPVLQVTRAVGSGGNAQFGMLVRDPAGEPLTQPANLFWRPGVTSHVETVQGSDTTGVWLPASYAEAAHAGIGDTITMSGTQVAVAGVYTDLFETDPGPYWCDYQRLFLNLASANTPPPALVLATDEDTFFRLAAAAGFFSVQEQVRTDARTLSVTDARGLLVDQERAQRAALPSDLVQAQPNERLADAVDRAETIERGLQGPVLPVAIAGGLLALVLVAAAGSFWADRRVDEVRLLAARGVGPAPLAGKAALELALPAVVGTAVGWGASRLLIAGLGPADDLDPAATTTAVWSAVVAFVVGLGCAAAVAGLRARGTAERPLGAAPRWPSLVPWELALLVAAGWCWVLLESRDAIVDDHGVAQVNGLLVAFPLLGIAGAAVLLTRLLTRLLPAVRRVAARRSPAVFLAVNRLAAARLATATLLVAVTLPVAVLGYTATLTSSSQRSLDAKVGVQVGAERAVVTVARLARDAQTAAVGTVVDRYKGSATGAGGNRVEVQVLAVDPATFAGTAFWDDTFADESLDDLVAALTGPDTGGRLPVVAAGLPDGDPDLRLGNREVPAEVVATARVLPGRRTADPVVLVAADRLPEISREAGADRTSELWTGAPRARAVEAATAAGATGPRVVEPDDVFTTANFLGITWTFGYLSALAVFVGVIAVGGLLLYLEARSRTRVSGYVMARRLGLSKGAHLRSLVVELAGVALAGLVLGAVLAAVAVAVVYRRLDVDLVRPPTPLLDVPWTAIGSTALAAVLVAVLAAAYAQRAADRADPATVLREDA